MALFAVGWLLDHDRIPLGLDWLGYRAGFERLLATGSPYARFELAASFTPQHLDFIHPPNFLFLVDPFAVLPNPLDFILWDAVPIAVFAYLLRHLAWWGWPLVAILSTTNSLQYPILNGNSSLWMCAAFGLGIRVGWSAGLLAMKPTLLPLAFVGLRRPVPALVLAIVPIVLTLPLFPDYFTVIRNMEGIPLSYSLSNYSLIALAALPWCVGGSSVAGWPADSACDGVAAAATGERSTVLSGAIATATGTRATATHTIGRRDGDRAMTRAAAMARRPARRPASRGRQPRRTANGTSATG